MSVPQFHEKNKVIHRGAYRGMVTTIEIPSTMILATIISWRSFLTCMIHMRTHVLVKFHVASLQPTSQHEICYLLTNTQPIL